MSAGEKPLAPPQQTGQYVVNGSVHLAAVGTQRVILRTLFTENSTAVGTDAGQIALLQDEAAFVAAKPITRDGRQIPDSINHGTAPPLASLLLSEDAGGAPKHTGPVPAEPCGYFGCTAVI